MHSSPHIAYVENIVYIAPGKRSTMRAQELGQECVHIGQEKGEVRFKKWLLPLLVVSVLKIIV